MHLGMLVGKWTQCCHDCLMLMLFWCVKMAATDRLTQRSILQDHRAVRDKTRWPAWFLSPNQSCFLLLQQGFYSLATANGLSTSILPQSWMMTSLRGLSRPSVFVPSIFFTTSWRRKKKIVHINIYTHMHIYTYIYLYTHTHRLMLATWQ